MEIEKMLEQAMQSNEIIIYGAHLVALEVYRYLQRRKRSSNVNFFVVTDMNGNPITLEGISVIPISKLEGHRNAHVIIAMPEKFHEIVEKTVRMSGFKHITKIGLKEISILKGNDLVQIVNKKNKKYYLRESVNDYNWLDLFEKKEDGKVILNKYCKFTILTRVSQKNLLNELSKTDVYAEYEKSLGVYRNLVDETEVSEIINKENYLNVYMVTCHRDQKLKTFYEPMYYIRPLQAGTALTYICRAEFKDNNGIHISEKNIDFAEMTAMYWVWKNAPTANYLGLCHYRRHFCLNKNKIQNLEKEKIDVLLPIPRFVLNGIKNMFLSDTPVKEDVFEIMLCSIKETVGEEYLEYAEKYFESTLYYPNNMLIAKKNIFYDYCNWIFPILFRMEEYDHIKGVIKKDRHIAFASELLTSLYFSYHKDSYKIAVVDYYFLE